MSYTYDYPRPALTADILVFRGVPGTYELLLIQRGGPPYQEMWALPGGFMDMNETLETTAVRELEEETGLKGVMLHQFRAYSSLKRDPRQRTVAVSFYGFSEGNDDVRGGDDAKAAAWFSIHSLPDLAFDHSHIVSEAIEELLS